METLYNLKIHSLSSAPFQGKKKMCILLSSFFFFFLVSSATECDRCPHQSKAAYFSRDSSLSSGACGYGASALSFFNGHLAAGVPSLYKDGARCGACYQIRCKSKGLCSKEGTRVILTDLNHSNKTDFVLSKKAFSAMAQKGKGKQILQQGIVDIEYKRVPCEYKKQNMSVRIHESSKRPHYLAITWLYVGGQTEIAEVHVSLDGALVSTDMRRRKNGAIWEADSVPEGQLNFQIRLSSSDIIFFTLLDLPQDWKLGSIYDTGIQIRPNIPEGQESCRPCVGGHWN